MNYKDLTVWQKSMDLVVDIYSLSKKFPKDELYILAAQMKRCVISIVSNIAEGSRRGTKKDYRHFLLTAYGSGAELETQIIITQRLGFATEADLTKANGLLDEIMRMLNKMTQELAN
jgi:four helix bundle protein